MSVIPDVAARQAALDPRQSYIVQAPAGSGKTELLIQRFLTLLAIVDEPEEIVAITFTRKAAGEMRQRITQALALACEPAPDQAHKHHTWTLARAALKRNDQQQWHLPETPTRLRIQTIDALCAALTRQMPLLSRFGQQPKIIAHPAPLYRQAASRALAELENAETWTEPLAELLLHLDNQVTTVEKLLAAMLARRDQWLRHILNERMDRTLLEQALARVIADTLSALRTELPENLRQPLVDCARYAACHLPPESDSPILACKDLDDTLPVEVEYLIQWQGLATLLLTQEDSFRRSVDKNIGFSAPSSSENKQEKEELKQQKSAINELLDDLRKHESLRQQLAFTRLLPPPNYSEQQWRMLEALSQILPLAVAHLIGLFRETGQVDFCEVSQRALLALGEEDAPTDLALALDYAIKHILMDEFQDTSLSQFTLIERLLTGWMPGDGRSLFLVGDPMQSIYRFREAEVGLFLRARQHGIGDLSLVPLTLSANFRSQGGIVGWVNNSFSRLMPQTEEVVEGAVPYTPSHAVHAPLLQPAVQVHTLVTNHSQAEAQQVVTIIQQIQASTPQASIAILARARSHFAMIVPALRQAGIRFQAVDLDPLASRPVVQDLLALTRALLYPAERLAWLAVLRAPWCGLSLADLYALGQDQTLTLRGQLQHWLDSGQPRLSHDGQLRLARIAPVLVHHQARREALGKVVENTWLALGGAAGLRGEDELADAEAFLRLLREADHAGDVEDFATFESQLQALYAQADADPSISLQLMTMHKAKGLEFDAVIVPGLHRTIRGDEKQLLLWQERPNKEVGSDLLLAPIQAAEESQDPLYHCLAALEKRKSRWETGRLLYVAATRAKYELHWVAEVTLSEQVDKKNQTTNLNVIPKKNSLLDELWSVVGEEVKTQALAAYSPSSAQAQQTSENKSIFSSLERLPATWLPSLPPPDLAWRALDCSPNEILPELDFDWAGETARHIGTVIHRWLQYLATQEHLPADPLPAVRRCRALLLELGVHASQLDQAITRVRRAVANTVNDKRGKWILSALHQDAHSEYALSGVIGERVVNVVMDRTFIDANGIRWIIDYKTGEHSGGGLELFLASEQTRYAPQLTQYARLMTRQESRPIRLGLYFPPHQAWREWAFEA